MSESVFSMRCRYLVIQRRKIGNRTICGEIKTLTNMFVGWRVVNSADFFSAE